MGTTAGLVRLGRVEVAETMFLRVLEFDLPGCGKISHALYRCDDCHDDYTCNSAKTWGPYNEQYCHECFPKHPGARPAIEKLY